jgi:glycosyltransferase involved in cell wall biosynthesis
MKTGRVDPPIRIACLATQAGRGGGAAIAMERLAAAVRGAGAEVDVVTRDDVEPLPSAARRLERRVRRGVRRARTARSNTLFTADWPAWDVAGHPAVATADLVNVHWVAGFLAAGGVRRIVESGRPVAWTLHDMRPFTGGCHYASGCRGFTADCNACPQVAAALAKLPERSLARARRRLRGLPLTFVAPSRWLAGELSRSRLFDPEAHAVRVIPNGLDLDRYAPGDRAAARRRLGLPEAGLGILLGSVSLDEHRKGAALAAAAVAAAATRLAASAQASLLVVTYGSGSLTIPGVACRHLGPLDEAGVLAAAHACNLHLSMAREDNLPNTVMEALACGLPVLATRTGGHPEMIGDGREGWLVEVDDVAAAAALLARLAGEPARVAAAGAAARQRALAEWDSRLQARRYLDLAADLAGQRPFQPGPALPPPGAVGPAMPSPAVAAVHPGGPLRGPLRRLRRFAAGRPRAGRSSTREASGR